MLREENHRLSNEVHSYSLPSPGGGGREKVLMGKQKNKAKQRAVTWFCLFLPASPTHRVLGKQILSEFDCHRGELSSESMWEVGRFPVPTRFSGGVGHPRRQSLSNRGHKKMFLVALQLPPKLWGEVTHWACMLCLGVSDQVIRLPRELARSHTD